MGDHDIEGQFEELLRILESPTWIDLWKRLGFTKEKFASLGLSEDSPDVVVWETCQARRVVLVTGNRNIDGPDSFGGDDPPFESSRQLAGVHHL